MSASVLSEWLLRLLLAALLGALVGAERELRGHPAGVRTQALVALAAALFTGVGGSAFSGPAADPTRVAAGVATGVGFLGAGVILHYRGSVRGLTTAATLWLSAAVGMAVGAGAIVPAVVAAVFGLVLIHGLRLLKPFIKERGVATVVVDYEQGHGTIGPLLRALQAAGGDVEDLVIDDEDLGSNGAILRHVRVRVSAGDREEIEERLDELSHRPEIKEIHLVNN